MSASVGPTTIIDDSLVLHLDAANSRSYPGTGTVWTDLSGNGNNGTLVNGTGYNSANGGSMVFDGVNDYCSIVSSPSIDITGGNITIEVIYKNNDLASATHGDGLISKGSGSNDGQYEILLIQSGGKNTAYFRCYAMGTYTSANILMDIGITYNVTCVLNNGYARIYINGEENGSGVQLPNSIVSRTQSLVVGSRQLQAGASSSAVNGNIYSAKVYNRALTAAEVRQNFISTKSRFNL